VLKKVYLDPLRMIADTKCAIFTHADLDQIFGNVDIIAMVNGKFLEELEAEHAKWPAVNYGAILGSFAKQFKGCYARYCNNFDHVDEHLKKLARSREPGEMEKHRYLEGSKTHPAAGGQDVRCLPPASSLASPLALRLAATRKSLGRKGRMPMASADEDSCLNMILLARAQVAAPIHTGRKVSGDCARLGRRQRTRARDPIP
jgi:hypothetical protein